MGRTGRNTASGSWTAASRPAWPNAISPMREHRPAPTLAHPEGLERIVGGVAYISRGDCYEYKSLACCLGCVSSLHCRRYYNVSSDLVPWSKGVRLSVDRHRPRGRRTTERTIYQQPTGLTLAG